jgi:hypothetical protein
VVLWTAKLRLLARAGLVKPARYIRQVVCKADGLSLQDFNATWHLATLKVVLFDNFRGLAEKSIPPEGFFEIGKSQGVHSQECLGSIHLVFRLVCLFVFHVGNQKS